MNLTVRTPPHRRIAFTDHDILVPFVCQRCGNCCRRYDPVIEMELLPEIARKLGEPIDVIQDRLRRQVLSHSAGLPTDCCFLHPRMRLCTIHEVKPTACLQFPSLDGAGAGAVDCGGYREFRRVLHAFTRHAMGGRPNRGVAVHGQRPIPPPARRDVRQTLAAAGVSEPYRLVFAAFNGLTDSSPA